MPEADGYVRIDTKIDDTKLIRQLNTVAARINRQTEALDKAKQKVIELEKEYERLSAPRDDSAYKAQLEKMEKARESLLKQRAEKQSDRDRVGGLIEKDPNNSALRSAFDQYSADISKINQKLRELRLEKEKLDAEWDKVKDTPSDPEAAEKARVKLEEARSTVNRLTADLENSKLALQKMQTPAEEVGKSLGRTRKNAGGLANYIGRLAKRMLLLYAFRRVFTYIRNSLMAMSGLSVVTGVFTDFTNKMREVYARNEEVQASLAKLRGALYTAFAPIYSAVVPALVSLVNWLAKAVFYLGSFFSAMLGKSLKDSAAGAKDLAKGVGAVGGAAKSANKQLATFDKLNTLSDNSGGGGGGGAEAVDTDWLEPFMNPEEDKINWWVVIGEAIHDVIQDIIDVFSELGRIWDEMSPEDKALAITAILAALIPLLYFVLGWPVALVAAIAALVIAVLTYYEQIHTFLTNAYNAVHDFFTNAKEEILNHITNTQKWLIEHFGILGYIFSAILEVIKGVLLAAFTVVETVVKTILNVISAVVETIHAIASGDWKKAWEAWKKVFTDIWNGLKGIVGSVINTILGVIENFINSAIAGINFLLSGLNSVGRLLGMSGTLQIGYITLPRVAFAEGGFPDAGSLFLAGEAGPELVGSFGSHNNTVVNEAQLVQAFQQASAEQVSLLQQQNSLLAAILDKTGTFKPSVAAGKAFSQSIGLYNRAMG